MPIRTGQLEEHVTADVAWALAHYAEWSGDRAFLTGAGRPLLVETARHWASQCRLDPQGCAHIDGVIGPDEYHESVDDNAYTNVMARWNLPAAADAVHGGSAYEHEAQAWRDLAEMVAAIETVGKIKRADCRSAAEQRFSLARMARDHERLYRRMLEQHDPKPYDQPRVGEQSLSV
jgi:trehalose/maltose hydrolase-like predicted phosphorylase